MIFHENRLPADDSHEKAYLIYFEIGKDVAKFVVLAILKGLRKGALLTRITTRFSTLPVTVSVF